MDDSFPCDEVSVREAPRVASVLIDGGLAKPLDYLIPPEHSSVVNPGSIVHVPVRKSMRQGYVLAVGTKSAMPLKKLRFLEVLQPLSLPKDLLDLAEWMAQYYCCPLAKVLNIMVPARIRSQQPTRKQSFVRRKKSLQELRDFCARARQKHPAQAQVVECFLKSPQGCFTKDLLACSQTSASPLKTLVEKGFFTLEQIDIEADPLEGAEYFPTQAKVLQEEQQHALEQIVHSVEARHFAPHLLYGVTGSGKTEVYLQAIEATLKQNLACIILVPEISLTAQTLERFQSRFQEPIALLHHRIAQKEKLRLWHEIYEGKCRLIIGPRSALFSPVPQLGLLIVDEEHEASYKQSDQEPRYQARDVAVMRAKISGCTVVLGSATPSLESYLNAQLGRYQLTTLAARADGALKPKMTIVDMGRATERAQGKTTLSDTLLQAIEQRYRLGEKSLLFLNRRGYHHTTTCAECGFTFQCPDCSVALTHHYYAKSLVCHLCTYTLSPLPRVCPQCQGADTLKFRGFGTEQVERQLRAIFPQIRPLRMDADTTQRKGSHDQLLRAFRSGKGDVLIGTQMIAKGLHFPDVTLVGILNADASLQIPDFRAAEHSFQMLMQVAGRSGRGMLEGEVIIQTFSPEHPVIRCVADQDPDSFYSMELASRKLFAFPPYTRIVKLIFQGDDEQQTLREGEKSYAFLRQRVVSPYHLHPLGPCGHARVKQKHRFQCLLRGPKVYTMNHWVQQTPPLARGVQLLIDVDPTSTYF